MLFDLLAEFGFELSRQVIWIGHAAVQDQFGLSPEVEGAAELFLQRLRQADPGLRVIEVFAAGREGRAGQDHGRDLREQFVAEDGADIDWTAD